MFDYCHNHVDNHENHYSQMVSLIFHTLLGPVKMMCHGDAWKPNKSLIPVKGTYFFILAGTLCQDMLNITSSLVATFVL